MDWRQRLEQAALRPPSQARLPLQFGGQTFGSMEPAVLRLAQQLLSDVGAAGLLVLQPESGVGGDLNHGAIHLVAPDLSTGLAQLAQALRQGQLTGGWRNEMLAVCDTNGERMAVVERGVTRVLGIATEAVHLVGWSHEGQLWVQQRALTKATDPGLWDTLMGGMVSAEDTVLSALVRETWEEAGLRLETLPPPVFGGIVQQQRPSPDGPGAYLIERAHWYHITLSQGVIPNNQDGEVQQFACLTRQQVLNGLIAGDYTLEASLILAQALAL
jgi:8-oxo-dGTP pyrophosphatase MutT (NUDIX family)